MNISYQCPYAMRRLLASRRKELRGRRYIGRIKLNLYTYSYISGATYLSIIFLFTLHK